MEIYNVYMYSNRDVVTLRLIFNCQLTTPSGGTAPLETYFYNRIHDTI